MKWIVWFEEISGTTRVVIFTLCCTGLFASSTWAQTHQMDPSTRGFSFGGHVAVIGANPDQFDLNGHLMNPATMSTAGGGLTNAYGLTEWLTFTLNADGRESEDDRHLSFGDIGAQFFLPGWNNVLPHLDIALTGHRAEFDTANGAIDTRGSGVSLGGGVQHFLSRSFA